MPKKKASKSARQPKSGIQTGLPDSHHYGAGTGGGFGSLADCEVIMMVPVRQPKSRWSLTGGEPK